MFSLLMVNNKISHFHSTLGYDITWSFTACLNAILMFMKSGRGATIAQLKGPGLVQLYHTCVGSNLERDIVFHLSLSLRGKKVIFLSSCRGIGVKKKFVEK